MPSRTGFPHSTTRGNVGSSYSYSAGIIAAEMLVCTGSTPTLRQDRLDDVPAHVGQAEVAALEAVDQLRVVDAEQIEHRGVQVVDVDRVLDRGVAELVGGAVGQPAFDPAAGQPEGKTLDVVV